MSVSLVNKERFNPSRLSKLAVWLDAGDSNTVQTAGNMYVTQWNDKSGNANNFTPDVLPRSSSTIQLPNPIILGPSWGIFPSTFRGYPMYITLGLDGNVYGYSDSDSSFFTFAPGGGESIPYITDLPRGTDVVGMAALQSTAYVYTVGNSYIGRIDNGRPPSFNPNFISLPESRYSGLSSTNSFLYTVDTINGTLIQINPNAGTSVIVWTTPMTQVLSGFVACTPGSLGSYYIYIGYTSDRITGVALNRLIQNSDGSVNTEVTAFGVGTFILQNPIGLVMRSDNVVYITDFVSGTIGGDLITMRIPTNTFGNIVLPVNTSWLTLGNPPDQGGFFYSPFVGTDGNLYIPYDTQTAPLIARVQPYETVTTYTDYYGPTYCNAVPPSYLSFTYGGGLKSLSNSGLTGSKTIMMVYNCPLPSSSMNVQVGQNVSGGAFGLAQISGLVYTPFQYGTGDIVSPPQSYVGINYAFASFDASSNNTTGAAGFDTTNLQASAFANNLANSLLRIGDPSNTLYTASGFQVYELIATSNAITTSDRQEMEAYLSAKWDLTLLSNHPYKDFQPSGDQWVPPGLPTTVYGLVSWLDMTIPGQTGTNITDSMGGSFSRVGNPLSLSNINNHPSLYFPGSCNAFLRRSMTIPAVGSALFVFDISDTRTNLPIIAFDGSPILVYSAPVLILGNNDGTGINGKNQLILEVSSGTNMVFLAWNSSNYYLSANGGSPVIGVGNTSSPTESTNFFIGGNSFVSNIPVMNFGELVVYNQYFEQAERQLVEGYLAWKWNIEGKLPAGHPYAVESPIDATVSEVSPLNIPGQIPSLSLWLDAADSATITTPSNIYWNDKSATADVFTGVGSPPATYSYTGSGNGPSLPGVYFSGLCSMIGGYSAAISSGTGSCFLVATILANAQVLMGGLQTGSVVEGNSFGFYSQGGNVVSPIQGWQNYYMNSFGKTNFSGPSVFFGQINIGVNRPEGQGSFQFSTPPTSQGTEGEAWQAYGPGKSPWVLGTAAGSPIPQNFYIHEFLCFSDYFTDSQRQLIEGYLAWKWGVQSQLPRGHPYEGGRPQSA